MPRQPWGDWQCRLKEPQTKSYIASTISHRFREGDSLLAVPVSVRSPHLQIFIHLLVDSIYRIARFAPSALNMGQRGDTRIAEQHLGWHCFNLKGGIRLRYKV